MLTRRTATVTISAPLASTARRVSSKSRYFPVPTIKRERKTRPPSSSLSSCISILLPGHHRIGRRSAAAHKIHHLDEVAFIDDGVFVLRLGHHGLIDLDRNTVGLELEFRNQARNRGRTVKGMGFAVKGYLHFAASQPSQMAYTDRGRSRFFSDSGLFGDAGGLQRSSNGPCGFPTPALPGSGSRGSFSARPDARTPSL